LSPTLVEPAEPRVEHVLLAVAPGAGLALLPESVTDRYATPGVRFVPLEEGQPAIETAVLTHRDSQSLATAAFLRALARAARALARSPPRRRPARWLPDRPGVSVWA
jgi:hypothetical protein